MTEIYIELGGGSAAKSLAHRAELRAALRAGIKELKSLARYDDARIVERVLDREWQQTRSPFYAHISKRECKALSRALRSCAYSLAGEERERALLGLGNVQYNRFRTAIATSRRVEQRAAREDGNA